MSWAIWVTGLPGSGKTTLARGLAEALEARGIRPRVLDLPAAQRALLPAGRGSEVDQEIVHRALAFAAKLLSEAGVPVIVDATAPRRSWREKAREMIPHFAEVQLLCPPEICGVRERGVRWSPDADPAARTPHSAAPEIVLDYEYSLRPDLVLHTDIRGPWATIEELVALALRLQRMDRAAPLPMERRAP